MKQVLHSFKDGSSQLADVPSPRAASGQLLIRTSATLVSAGTERMLVEFGKANWLDKARSRPDLVRQVLDKAKREGVLTTLESVRNRLDQPLALGYSCAGVVIAVGEGVHDFQIGDRVACAGGGYAVHAEVVNVPKNLVVKLPDDVDIEFAAFTTLGAIALQGIRLAGITGWAQVNGRTAISGEQKFALDVWYVEHQSLWLDLKILALTGWKSFRREGINQPGQVTAEEFMGSRS